MPEYTFDEHGYLKPRNKIHMTFEEFQRIFVEAFGNDSTRLAIFENYQKFIEDFQKTVTPNFIQWVNGSFVTQKPSPNDIDFVTILDYKIFNEFDEIIDKQFRQSGAIRKYGRQIDVYAVRQYPEGHPQFEVFKGELAYWQFQFSETKRNRANKKFQKGFIELKFGN